MCIINQKHILVAADDDLVRCSIIDTLKNEGFAISEAPDGLSALKIIMTYLSTLNKVDFLITDINMPKMSGLELLDILNKRGVYISTILISGDIDSELVEKIKTLKNTDFLEKPFKLSELVSKMQLIISDT